MKIVIIEATAEELQANRRVGDSVCDAVIRLADSIASINYLKEEEDEDSN